MYNSELIRKSFRLPFFSNSSRINESIVGTLMNNIKVDRVASGSRDFTCYQPVFSQQVIQECRFASIWFSKNSNRNYIISRRPVCLLYLKKLNCTVQDFINTISVFSG